MGNKLTQEEVIKKFRKVHGNRYDYSKFVYINCYTKGIIICSIHGEFLKSTANHNKKQGCSKCIGRNRSTTEEFIIKAREVHGNKYDYSKFIYINTEKKGIIICPIHGEFEKIPYHHTIRKQGCSKCIGKHRPTTEEFIKKAKNVHGNKYDYSKFDYLNSFTKGIIICPIHGEFEQISNNHLKGQECPRCSGHFMDKTYFIDKARKIHGNKYDYSKFDYLNSSTKGIIICPIHGEFEQNANSHLSGSGCPKCIGREKTTEQFIKESKKIHGNKYDYSKFVYFKSEHKGIIICHSHGEFMQTAYVHLKGSGCPKCAGNKKASPEEIKNKIIELLQIYPKLTAKLWTKLHDQGIIDKYYPRTMKDIKL